MNFSHNTYWPTSIDCFMAGRFPLTTAARTAKVGLYTGLAFGLVQDALSLARGRRLGYVEFLFGVNRQRNYIERESRFG